MYFDSNGCEIRKKLGKSIAKDIRTRSNLYSLSRIKTYSNTHICLMSQVEERWLCHKRLRHFDNLVKVSKNQNANNLPPINKFDNDICNECHHDQETRGNFKTKEYFSTKPLQIVHTDLCGPNKTRTLNGER